MMDAHQKTWHMTDVAVKRNGERIRLSVNDGGTVGFLYGKKSYLNFTAYSKVNFRCMKERNVKSKK